MTIFTDSQHLELRIEDLAWREVHDELVVLEMATATYLSLNGSAKVLWQRLLDGATVRELQEALMVCYGISDDRADADVREFLKVLVDRSLLVTDSAVGPGRTTT